MVLFLLFLLIKPTNNGIYQENKENNLSYIRAAGDSYWGGIDCFEQRNGTDPIAAKFCS